MMRFNNITIIISILLILSSSAFAEDEQIFNNWSYPHYQDNQLIWEMKGKTAMVREDKIILSGLELIYYLQPVSPTAQVEVTKKGRVFISADTGTLKKQQQTVSLHDNIIVKKISEPINEFDEIMMTDLLLINLADKTFSNDALLTITRSDIIIKSKGCNGGLDFGNISFLSKVETVIRGCDSKSVSLGLIFSPKPNIDDEVLSKNPTVITITSEGPMSTEKINGNPTQKVTQRISFQNKVALNSSCRQADPPSRIMNLHSDNLDILLDRRENPVTKRNNFYLSNISATGNVTVDDSLHRAECSSLVLDDTAELITLKSNNKSLATITRPLKPNNDQSQTKSDSYISIAAQTLNIQTEKDNLLLLGRKEIIFSNGSIYNPEPISPTDVVSPTDTAPPTNPPADLSTQIKITADSDGLVSLRESQIYLENNVQITQWATTNTDPPKPELKATIKCNKLFINWSPAKNLLERLKSEGNVYISSDGSEAWGEILEWTPLLSQINIKSRRKVKILHKNSSIDGDEIVITTNPQDAIDNWTNIEIKNKTNGSIKIAPKEDEKPK